MRSDRQCHQSASCSIEVIDYVCRDDPSSFSLAWSAPSVSAEFGTEPVLRRISVADLDMGFEAADAEPDGSVAVRVDDFEGSVDSESVVPPRSVSKSDG